MNLDLKMLPLILLAVALALFFFAAWWRRRRLRPFELDTATVDVGEWTWRYHMSGSGPALLLLHGIGANLYCWRWLIPQLTSNFRVIAVDLPGFGGSSKPRTATYGLDEQCERLCAFLDRMKIEKAYLIGNSMGGNIALWLARTRPDRVAGVGVIAPATSPRLVPLNVRTLEWMSGPLSLAINRLAIRWVHGRTVSRKDRIDPARIEESIRTYARNPDAVRSFLRATEAIRDPRLPGELRGLKTKVLLLWGSRDKLVSKKVMEDLESALPEAESQDHDGGGHHLQEDDPDWVAAKIVQFFRRHPDQTP